MKKDKLEVMETEELYNLTIKMLDDLIVKPKRRKVSDYSIESA